MLTQGLAAILTFNADDFRRYAPIIALQPDKEIIVLTEAAAHVLEWLVKVLAYSFPAASLVLALFKWSGNTWIGRFLNRDLEQFKEKQQEKLESFKTDQQKELERLRNLLSSRVSRIHEKEFEVLPQAWLMLNELQGAIANALDLTIKSYPDFYSFSDAKLEAFLSKEVAAQRLNEFQVNTIKSLDSADKKLKFYMDALMVRNLDDAENKRRLFNNFLIQHKIFMSDELRATFTSVHNELLSALHRFSMGKSAGNNVVNWELVHSGQQVMLDKKIQELIDEAGCSIQKRLRYAEAE